MTNIITVKIDVTLIDKSRLFVGTKKKNRNDVFPKYLDLILIPTKPTQYGDWRDEQTHIACQSTTKDERDAGQRGEIIGNAIERTGHDRRAPAAPPPVESDSPKDSDND